VGFGGRGRGRRGEGSEVKQDCASTLGSVGAKGVLLLGTDECSRKIGDEPINVTSFSFSKKKNKFSLAYGCPWTISQTISKKIMSFSNLTTFFFFPLIVTFFPIKMYINLN
jgi:hypothetical protein